MPELVPGIHVLGAVWWDVDGPDEPGHDDVGTIVPQELYCSYAIASSYPTLAVTTAITDSSSTIVTSCSEATGCVRQAVILSESDRWASKNFGS